MPLLRRSHPDCLAGCPAERHRTVARRAAATIERPSAVVSQPSATRETTLDLTFETYVFRFGYTDVSW